jgi:hypothetical protein
VPNVILSNSPGCTCCPEVEAPCNECTRRPPLRIVTSCVYMQPTDCGSCVGGSDDLTWDSVNQYWEFSIPASPAVFIRCFGGKWQLRYLTTPTCNCCGVQYPTFNFTVISEDTCSGTRSSIAPWIDAESFTCNPISMIFRLPPCNYVEGCWKNGIAPDFIPTLLGSCPAYVPEQFVVVSEI